MRPVLLDTGPWVAYLNRRDQHHEWARRVFGELRPPLLTCESVVSEACFLAGPKREAVMEMLAGGIVRLAFQLDGEVPNVRRLMDKYASVPISLADACLVRMAARDRAAVLTVDSDFRLYRLGGRRPLELIAPFA